MQDNNIGGIIRAALENVKSIVDSDTLIGEPINTPSGTMIIPVSKISVGLASGGLDFNSKKKKDDPENAQLLPQNFGGGGGTGLVMTPVGFLVVKPDGSVEMLNIGPTGGNAADPVGAELSDMVAGFIRHSPDYITKIKNAFRSRKSGDKGVKTEETETETEAETEIETETVTEIVTEIDN